MLRDQWGRFATKGVLASLGEKVLEVVFLWCVVAIFGSVILAALTIRGLI